MVTQLESRAYSQITSALANIDVYSVDPMLQLYLLTDDADERYALLQRPLLAKLSSIQKAYPEYYEIRVLLANGEEDLLLSTDPATTAAFTSSRVYPLQGSGTEPKASIAVNPADGRPVLFVSQPISLVNPASDRYGSTPTLRGYLCMTVSIGAITDYLSPSPWKEGGVVLTNDDGEIYAASDELDLQRLLAGRRLTTGSDGVQQQAGAWLEQIPYHYQRTHIYEGLWAHVLVPESELFEQSRTIGWLALLVALGSLALVLPLLILLHRQVLKPINALHHAIGNLGRSGELVQVTVSHEDEIADLGRSFNRMSRALHRSSARIKDLAFSDSLTGLPNRTMFVKTLKRGIERAKVDDSHLALMFIDLDNFKMVNDTLGHQAGDQLLVAVTEIIRSKLRGDDLLYRAGREEPYEADIARLGGDEFTLILSHAEAEIFASRIADRIVRALAQPIQLAGNACYVGCSIGIAVYPFDGDTDEALVKHADLAMYHAKHQGKGNFQFFSSEIANCSQRRALLDQRLHLAVEAKSFRLHYQPIVDSRTQRLVAVEALIRWQDEALGSVPPDEFIPIAEETGLIFPIGCWVMGEAMQQLAAWKLAGGGNFKVSINVSSIQLSLPGLAPQIRIMLEENGLIPSDIYVELTETALMKGREQALENLRELRALGVRVALDDFGTGYSSLSYLKDLPIDILKIDRSFIMNLQERNNRVILVAIISMAHALGMKVVAEGVEDEEHIVFLRTEGCDLFQGYCFSRPVAPADLVEYVNRLCRRKQEESGTDESLWLQN